MKKWLLLIDALRKGAQLAKPETWKSVQLVSTLVAGALVSGYSFLVAMGLGDVVPDDALSQLGVALGAAVYTLVQAYLTVATTKKIGVLPPAAAPAALADPVQQPADASVPPDGRRGSPPSNPFFD